jgi:EamA domain-containing membrane protein RarD
MPIVRRFRCFSKKRKQIKNTTLIGFCIRMLLLLLLGIRVYLIAVNTKRVRVL